MDQTSCMYVFQFIRIFIHKRGARWPLRYKSAGGGLDSRWCH